MEEDETAVFWYSDLKPFLNSFVSNHSKRNGYYFRVIKAGYKKGRKLTASFTNSNRTTSHYWLSIGRKCFGEIIFPLPLKLQVVSGDGVTCSCILNLLLDSITTSEFVLTDTILSVISPLINGPAIVVVKKKESSVVFLSGRGIKYHPYISAGDKSYFLFKHFSKYRILHDFKAPKNDGQTEMYTDHAVLDTTPITSNERRMFFLQSSTPDTTAYNIPVCLRLKSLEHFPLRMEDVCQLITRMVNDNSKLRTVYGIGTEGLGGNVLPIGGFQNVFNVAMLPSFPVQTKVIEMTKYFRSVSRLCFDLTSSVFSSHALSVGDNEVLVILLFHHIAVDGIAVKTLLQQMGKRESYSLTDPPLMPPLKTESTHVQKWERYLSDISFSPSFAVLNMHQSQDCGYLHVQLKDSQFMNNLKLMAQTLCISVSSIVTSALGLALCTILRCNKVLLGYVNVGRSLDNHKSIGFFADTLPLSIETKPNLPFESLARLVHTKILLIHDSFIKLDDLIPIMNVPHDKRGKSLFNFVMVYQDIFENLPNEVAIDDEKISCESWFDETVHAQTELTLEVIPESSSLSCRWQFQPQRLDKELVMYLHCIMTEIMHRAFKCPSVCIHPWIQWQREQLSTVSQLYADVCSDVPECEYHPSDKVVVDMPLPPGIVAGVCSYSASLGVLPCAIHSIALGIVLSPHVRDSTITLKIARQHSGSDGISMHSVSFDFSTAMTVEEAVTSFQTKLSHAIHSYSPASLYHCQPQAALLDYLDISSEWLPPAPLVVHLLPQGIQWNFLSSDYDPQQLTRHYLNCLVQMLSGTSNPINSVPLCTSTEEHFLLTEVNDTFEPFDEMETTMDCLSRALSFHSYKIAFVDVDVFVTYADLYDRMKYAMQTLVDAGVIANSKVGVFMNRCFDLFLYAVAIMYLGATYVPLPTNSPAKRLLQICGSCNMRVLVTCSEMLETLEEYKYKGSVLCTDTLSSPSPSVSHPFLSKAHPDGIAYIIHTSGTTGLPKGVCVTHKNMRNLLVISQQLFTADDLIFTRIAINISFDPHILELFPTLLAGGCCVITEDITCQSPAATCIITTPSALSVCPPTDDIRVVVTGGETLVPAQYSIVEPIPNVINAYGPTECTVLCTANDRIDHKNTSCIGMPVANTKLFILNRHSQLSPLGGFGILFIAGHCVAEGYLNDPDKTSQLFTDSFKGSGRMYCTGDVVYMRYNGTLDYFGRGDSQVKLRGFRLELGEVESALRSLDGLQEAVAVVTEVFSGNKQLIAYVTPGSVCTSEVLAKLKAILPSYMVPYMIVPLDSFPLTNTGKLDRKSLVNFKPNPNFRETMINDGCASEEIKQVKELFASVLQLDHVSDDDNFYALGGHSLLALQLSHKISETFHIKLHPTDVLNSPTPSQLASVIMPYITKNVQLSRTPEIPYKGCKTVALTPEKWVGYLLKKVCYKSSSYMTRLTFVLKGGMNVKSVSDAGEAVLHTLGINDTLVYEVENLPHLVQVQEESVHKKQGDKCCRISLSTPGPFELQLDMSLHRVVFNSWATESIKEVFTLFLNNLFPELGPLEINEGLSEIQRTIPSSDELGFSPYCVSWSTRLTAAKIEDPSMLIRFALLSMWKMQGERLVLHHWEDNHQKRAYAFRDQCIFEIDQELSLQEAFNDIITSVTLEDSGDILLYNLPPCLLSSCGGIKISLHSVLPIFSEYLVSIGTAVSSEYVTFLMSYHTTSGPCSLIPPHTVVDFVSKFIQFFQKDPNVSMQVFTKSLTRLFPFRNVHIETTSTDISHLNSILGVENFGFEFLSAGASIWDSPSHQARLNERSFNIAVELQSEIRKRLNVHFPLQSLLLCPSKETVQKSLTCLYFLSQGGAGEVQNLNDKDVRPQIFCFQELTGYPWIYQNIAHFINYKMILLQYNLPTLRDSTSLVELVRPLVDRIVGIQPSGPYYLLGYSFGAVLAFVAANDLIKRGMLVESVILIDGSPAIIPYLSSDDVEFKWIWDQHLFVSVLGIDSCCCSSSVVGLDFDLQQFFPWFPLSSNEVHNLYLRIAKPLKLASRHRVESLGPTSCSLLRAPSHSLFSSLDYGLCSLCALSVHEIPLVDHSSIIGKAGARSVSNVINSLF